MTTPWAKSPDETQTYLADTLRHAHPRVVLWYSYYDTVTSRQHVERWNALRAAIALHPNGR